METLGQNLNLSYVEMYLLRGVFSFVPCFPAQCTVLLSCWKRAIILLVFEMGMYFYAAKPILRLGCKVMMRLGSFCV